MNQIEEKLRGYRQFLKKGAIVFTEAYYRSFKITPIEMPKDVIRKLLEGKGMGNMSLKDAEFAIETWETMEEIIATEWISNKDYTKYYYDCDNFADAFKVYVNEFGLTNVAYAEGYRWKDPEDKRSHAFNVIITQDGGLFKPIVFEPQSAEFGDMRQGRFATLGDYTYRVDKITMG